MALTDKQLSERETGIGASEAGAVLDLDPFSSPLEVWARKRTPTRAPILGPKVTTPAMDVGNELEEPVARLYAKYTGNLVTPGPGTVRHPSHDCIIATPDRIVFDPKLGVHGLLEIKVPGVDMAHYWADDGVPDHTEIQARQQIAVARAAGMPVDFCDVYPLIGTDPGPARRVWRDEEQEHDLIEVLCGWWEVYVDGDLPPEPTDPDERRAWLMLRYPFRDGEKEPEPCDDDDVIQAFRWLQFAKEAQKTMAENLKALETSILQRIGSAYGLGGSWGKIIAPTRQGQISYKDIAEELAGGELDPALVARHRGQASRYVSIYGPPKPRAKGRKS